MPKENANHLAIQMGLPVALIQAANVKTIILIKHPSPFLGLKTRTKWWDQPDTIAFAG
ncbi:hypothetical protein GCM10028808_39500 [Spirosoma migulaei]